MYTLFVKVIVESFLLQKHLIARRCLHTQWHCEPGMPNQTKLCCFLFFDRLFCWTHPPLWFYLDIFIVSLIKSL